MDYQLLEILACPVCKGKLKLNDANDAHPELICRFDKLAYPVHDDIPIMLTEKARRLTEEE